MFVPSSVQRIVVITAIVALTGCAGGTLATPQGSALQSVVKSGAPLSFSGVKHAQSRARTNEVGPGCTQVTVSQNVQNALGGTPPYSAEIAVTNSSTTVNPGNIDAHGCDFGVYVGSGVSGVVIQNNQIHDADQVGVLVDGATYVNTKANSVSQIGNHTNGVFDPNGVQTGLGVYYDAGSGAIANNDINNYQKNGITLVDNSTVGLVGNFVQGLATPSGKTQFIAQNGIEIVGSALTRITGNTAIYNEYAYPNYAATGFLICNATLNGTTITKVSQIESKKRNQQNLAVHNDINFFISPSPSC